MALSFYDGGILPPAAGRTSAPVATGRRPCRDLVLPRSSDVRPATSPSRACMAQLLVFMGRGGGLVKRRSLPSATSLWAACSRTAAAGTLPQRCESQLSPQLVAHRGSPRGGCQPAPAETPGAGTAGGQGYPASAKPSTLQTS